MILIKGNNEKITDFPWLSQQEFDCNCNRTFCHYTHVDKSTVSSFLAARHFFGEPIIVESAYRCQSWNLFCGGSDSSLHLLGKAMDLTTSNADKMEELGQVLRRFFDVVIWYDDKKFYHAHNLI